MPRPDATVTFGIDGHKGDGVKRLLILGGMLGLSSMVVLSTPALDARQAGRGQGRGAGRGARTRKVVLAWADTRNGIAQHDSVSHALSVIESLGSLR